jgi:hypothetical protein
MTSLGASGAKRIKPWMANALTHWMTVWKSVMLRDARPVPRLLRTLTLTLKEPLWTKPKGGLLLSDV